MKTEQDILAMVARDEWMMKILRAAESKGLHDWWIGAGFVRSRVWDILAGVPVREPSDIDLVYFDAENTEPERDWQYEDEMNEQYPGVRWEVRNQARMHNKNGLDPFTSTEDGISHWVETATCVAVSLSGNTLRLLTCYGIEDLLKLTARPIPYYARQEHIGEFRARVESKKWQERWPGLTVDEAAIYEKDISITEGEA